MAHIRLRNVDVRFPVPTQARHQSLLASAAKTVSFGRLGGGDEIATIEALRNLSLDLNEGDRVGLIGRNGAGKSTLLRTLAGVIAPTSGTRDIVGSVSTIFNLATGLDLDRTGRESARFIARLLGLPRQEEAALHADVEAFTELGAYYDLPVRTYSSGMLVRLLFAATTFVSRDIILVDEVIGAGDTFFIDKAKARALEVFGRSKILVLASHSRTLSTELTNRTIWMERGEIVMQGDPDFVWDMYYRAHGRPDAP